MQLIKPSFEILEQGSALEDIYKHIELCGRTCYKSQDKITDGSAKPFVDRMIASKHYAMLEHGTVYLYDRYDVSALRSWDTSLGRKYSNNKYSKVNTDDYMDIRGIYITTNLRVIAENNWWDDLKYLCEPTIFHKKRYTVKFICDIGVQREFCRHRVFSFANESTRYCNYSKSRFNGEVIYIEPIWYKDADSYTKNEFDKALEFAEGYYKFLIDKEYKAQDARNILPLATKSELIMTGFEDDWCHFFALRALGTTGAPHPQAKELAGPLMEEFIKRGYTNETKIK